MDRALSAYSSHRCAGRQHRADGQTQYSFEPYRKTVQTGAANGNNQQFTGRENDGTGVYY